MSQWHVELISKDAVLLDFLTTCLHEPTCTIIEKCSKRYYALEKDGQPLYRTSDPPTASEDKHYYWLASDFDHFPDPQAVHMYASQQLPLLNSIARLKYGDHISSINIDDVYLPDKQDRLIKHTATVPPVTGRLVTSESMLQTANTQPPTIAALWQAAHRDTAVEEVMNHFANQRNWFNLYKAYEVIKKETRRLENSRKMKRGTFDKIWTGGRWLDFEESANRERHSSLGYQPRPGVTIVYMSLPEATAFVTQLIFQSLRTK